MWNSKIRKERPTASLAGSTLAVKLVKMCPIILVFGENFCCDVGDPPWDQ